MKMKHIKKFDKAAALILMISLLSALFTPARSADYTVGSVMSFEIRDESTGENVTGTILNKSATDDVASYYDPYVCTRLNISNVKVYIDGGNAVDWESYYWKVSSLNPNVAEAVGERKTDGDKNPVYSEGIYDSGYFLRVDVKSAGTTVINVEVSASMDMSESLKKTFTVRVIDDSKDGEVRADFQKGAGGVNLDLKYEVKINMTETADISIVSVTGYDYSNLNADYEKKLLSYSWSAEVAGKTGNVSVSASLSGVFSDSAGSSVDGENGSKTLYIQPLNEGSADIVVSVVPGESYGDKYKPSTQTIRLYVSRVVGNIEFNPVSEIYGEDTPAENVGVELRDFRIEVNGESKDISELVNGNNASLTAYATVPRDKISAGISVDSDDSPWYTNPADTTEVKCSVDISADFLQNPVIPIPLSGSAGVRIDVEGYIYNEFNSVSKQTDIKFISGEDDGKIAHLSFMSSGETVYPGKTLEAKTDKNGVAESDVILDHFEVEVYDSGSPSSGFKKRLNSYEYTIRAEADKEGIADISVDNGLKRVIITPLKAGNVKIKVTAEASDSGFTSEVQFNLISSNVGILSADEGKIVSVELKRDDKNQKIYTGEDKVLYLKNGIGDYGALTVNIDKVLVLSANKPNSGYMQELKNYKWDISQQHPNYEENMLSAEQVSGITDSGKAGIRIGTEKIIRETEKITVTIKITPQITAYEEGGEVYVYDESKSFEVSFKITVNEIGGKFVPEIDYYGEKVSIVTSKNGEDKGYYSFSGSPEYMYCLQAVGDGASQTAEKWLPFMGSSMDISKLIPKSGNLPYRIAFKTVGAEIEEDGNYSADNRKVINLYPRRTVTATERKSIVYKDEKIMFGGSKTGLENVLYKIGLSDYTTGQISDSDGISVPAKSNPLGGTVTIKFAALIDSENEENNRFASAEFKIKVPRTGKLPAVKDDRKKKYTGFTDKMIWSPTGAADSWEYCSKGAVLYENLKLAFPDLRKDASGKFYNLYIKTAATLKVLESEILIIKIPADKYER